MNGRGLAVDIPVSWLTAPWWASLTLAERGAYVSALAWSMMQRLDGDVPQIALRFIDENTTQVAEALDHFARMGRVAVTDEGWAFVDWEGMQHQNSAATIERGRQQARDRQARRRSRVTADVTRDAPRDIAGDPTGDRERDVGEVRAGTNADSVADVTWNVVTIPTGPATDEPF